MRSRNVAYALLLVLAIAVAAGAVFLWASSRAPHEGSAEAGFARDMMVHHAQAVEMAEIVRDGTENPQVRILAADIALTQQAQIGQMQGWLAVWGLPATGTGPAMEWMGHPTEGRMPGMATPAEVNRLRTASPEEADESFLRLMITHHRAAVPMAKAVLKETPPPAVEQLARAIVASQQAEIKVMEGMLRDMGAPPAEGEDPAPMDGMDMEGSHHE
jgi:uncharacterized protein (DUF305 family)